MPQLSILDDLDAAGAHPGSIRPPHVRYTETWRPGDAVPPGISPPAGDKRVPWRNWVHGPEYDGEVAREIWDAVWASIWLEHADAPFPFDGFVETKRLPDGAAWGCLEAILDGGLSFVTLREGHLAWEDAPGAGPIVYAADTHTWVRLPSKDVWDDEAQAWVPKGATPKVTSAPPDMEATETGGPAAFLHAANLANDGGWKTLAASLARTTPADVRRAAEMNVAVGRLSVANANALLKRAGVSVTPPPEEPATVAEPAPKPFEDDVRHQAATRILAGTLSVTEARALLTRTGAVEPEDRSVSVLLTTQADVPDLGLGADAWALIHGVEDGWFTLRRPGGTMAPAELTVTVLGTTRIWAPVVKAADGGNLFEPFMRLQAASHAAREASRRPLEEMEKAGLIRLCGSHGRAFLPPLSDVLALRYVMSTGNLERIDLYIREGADPDDPLVRRVEAICGVTAQPGGEELWARRASARSQARPRAESDDDVVAERIRHGEEPVPSPSRQVPGA